MGWALCPSRPPPLRGPAMDQVGPCRMPWLPRDGSKGRSGYSRGDRPRHGYELGLFREFLGVLGLVGSCGIFADGEGGM